MKEALVSRRRASLAADLVIVVLGVWGFVLQTLKCWLHGNERSDELDSES